MFNGGEAISRKCGLLIHQPKAAILKVAFPEDKQLLMEWSKADCNKATKCSPDNKTIQICQLLRQGQTNISKDLCMHHYSIIQI